MCNEQSLIFKVSFTNEELLELKEFALKLDITMDKAFIYLAKSNLIRMKNVSIANHLLPR